MNKLNWKEIQKYHDEGHNRGEICKKFGCAYSSIKFAEKRGDFKQNPKVCQSHRFKCDYDWKSIQDFYDKGHSTREITETFGLGSSTIMIAKEKGLLKLRTRAEANSLASKLRPRKLSQETKDKISKSRIAYLEKNPDQVPYLLNHYSKKQRSYPEEYFYNWLIKEQIDFKEQEQVSYYAIDFLIGNIALEIDGEQHYVDCRVWIKDRRRDDFLDKKGIQTIRVRWSCYQKMSYEDKSIYLSNLKEKLAH